MKNYVTCWSCFLNGSVETILFWYLLGSFQKNGYMQKIAKCLLGTVMAMYLLIILL